MQTSVVPASGALFLASVPLVVVLLAPARCATAADVRFDPAVIPAGGAHCQGCRSPGCGNHGCRPAMGHHADCRNGHCVPYCPVRPGQFGFYGTQWRRWPGSGIVQASALEAATPVAPPRMEVPGPGEESPQRPEGAGEAEANAREPGGGGSTDDAAADRQVMPLPPSSEPLRPLPNPEPALEPALEPAAEPTPEPTPEQPAADERPNEPSAAPNPFDEGSNRGWRRFLTPVSGMLPRPEPQDRGPEPVVAPVQFDQLDEVRAADSARGRKISVATP